MNHSCLIPIVSAAILFGCSICASAQSGHGKWDKALDEYEVILDEARAMKNRLTAGETVPEYEVYGLSMRLSSIRSTLSKDGSGMTEAQKARLSTLKRFYSAAGDGVLLSSPGYIPPMDILPCSVDSAFPKAGPGRPVAVPVKYPMHFFASLTFSGFDSFIPGIRAGVFRKSFGVYVSGRLSPGRKDAAYSCMSDGSIQDGGGIYTTGEQSRFHWGISAGGIFLPVRFAGFDKCGFGFYAGVGYGKRSLFWEDINHDWALVSDRSWDGVAAEAGPMLIIDRFILSAGINTVLFRHYDVEVAVGIRF